MRYTSLCSVRYDIRSFSRAKRISHRRYIARTKFGYRSFEERISLRRTSYEVRRTDYFQDVTIKIMTTAKTAMKIPAMRRAAPREPMIVKKVSFFEISVISFL